MENKIILFAVWGMLLGFILPFFSGRFGKLIPADPGEIILRLFHRPRIPHKKNEQRYLLWKKIRNKLYYWGLFWAGLCAVLFALVSLLIPAPLQILACLFIWIVCASIIVDALYCLLPDFFTLPLLLLGILFATQSASFSVEMALAGAFSGYLVSILSVLALAFSPKKELGCGDVKMITALGSWLGVIGLSSTLILSFLFFVLFSALNIHKKGAYGPALGVAAFISFFLIHMK